jgi:hypothetical protein
MAADEANRAPDTVLKVDICKSQNKLHLHPKHEIAYHRPRAETTKIRHMTNPMTRAD